MTIRQAINILRHSFGARTEHHPNCSSQQGVKSVGCDCYAKITQTRHECLDVIEEVLWEGKSLAAQKLGRKGGLKGGPARAKALGKKKLKAAARKAAQVRWSKRNQIVEGAS